MDYKSINVFYGEEDIVGGCKVMQAKYTRFNDTLA